MSKRTKAERIAEYLTGKGYREVASSSRKYRKFVRDHDLNAMWVGKCGAVRVGRTVSDSISLSAHI